MIDFKILQVDDQEVEYVLVEVQDVEYELACKNGCQGSSGSPTGG